MDIFNGEDDDMAGPDPDWKSAVQMGVIADVETALATIRKFRNVWRELSRDEKFEIVLAEDLLKSARSRCYHTMLILPLFTTVERRCQDCGMVDISYRHYR